MLSPQGVPPRQEGGRLASDADEEEELEEGEARLDGDEDSFDPDAALSYIDEKLQHVLGHFQKEFEGGVFADNLGPKFGGYGSFLPTHQHSPPLLPQARGSHVVSSIITSQLPCQPSAERMDRNFSTVALESISRNNDSIAPSTSDLCKKERCSNTNSEESVAGSDSLDNSFNDTDSKSLKIEMKVDSNCLLPTKNAAIYCGLGLDISSSSSMGDSPEGLGGLSPEFSNVPYESPQTILQVMTCFQVPGGFTLSPLHDKVLQLTDKVAPLLKKWEAHLGKENVPKEFDGHLQSSLSSEHIRGLVAKELKSGKKKAESLAKQLKSGSKKVESQKDCGENLPNRCPEDMQWEKPTKQVSQIISCLCTESLKERKLKNKRGMDQDNDKMLKKARKEDQHQIKRDWDHKCDSAGSGVAPETKYFPEKEKNSNILNSEEMVSKVDNSLGNVKESQAIEKPIFHGSLQGSCNANNKKVVQSAQSQLLDITCLERVSDNKLSKASWRKEFPENGTGVGTGERHLPSSDKKNIKKDIQGPSQQGGSNVTAHKNNTSAHSQGCGSNQKLGISFGEERLKLRISYEDIQKSTTQNVCLPAIIKEGKQELCSTPVKFDVAQMNVLSKRSNLKNGMQHAAVRQAGYKPADASPIGNDGSLVAFALKEARDLKHKANHLKSKGLELESTSLYFEAALKFLHVAFLLETPSLDGSRPGDAAQSAKMYSETAILCKFCAQEYERSKKMATAALAYKCVEVAYLKAAYCKYPGVSNDQQELQAVVQMTPDIDNICSHGLSKISTSTTKDGSSPQVAGTHLPQAVRNQAHLLQLLAYTNDVNHAFDATCKSQLAIVSATGREEKKGVDDSLASVKTVLDFSFNNINELIRLVRLSMESINM